MYFESNTPYRDEASTLTKGHPCSVGSFLLSSDFLPDGMMNATTVAASYGTIEAKSEFDHHQPPISLLSPSESSSFSGSSFSSGSSTSPPCSSASSMPHLLSAMDFTSPVSYSLPRSNDDTSSPSFSPPSQPTPPPKKANHGGRKRTIIFQEAEAEIQRKELLERNRIAASKCRQKKKKWMKDLETNYEKLSTHNQQLRSMVLLFQEEINSLKTELLSRNGLCSCTDMRSYFQHNTNCTFSGTSLMSSHSLPPLSLPPYLNE